MIRLDKKLLDELGLSELPVVEREAFLDHFRVTLEARVGFLLTERLSRDQLEEFEALVATSNEAGSLNLIMDKIPDYQTVVRSEFESLKKEVRILAPEILGTTIGHG